MKSVGYATEVSPCYDFFISYYHGTGFDFAKYLKDHVKDFNRTAFLDKSDIHTEVREQSDEWRAQIDEGITNSKNFVLLMTLGFNNRPEIKREWKKALASGSKCILFKKDNLRDQDLLMELDNEIIDFSKYNYSKFSDNCELLDCLVAQLRRIPSSGMSIENSSLTSISLKPSVDVRKPKFNCFQEIYSFAISFSGMNLSDSDAREFANYWITTSSTLDFSKFKQAFSFANSFSGMNLNNNESKNFALDWVIRFSDKDIEEFKKRFSYANSICGLNMNVSDAKKFAINMLTK
jgi:hypothetical protein